MDWIKLQNEEALKEVIETSKKQPVLLFKHSTRCPISATALNRLERDWKKEEAKNIPTYYIDLLSYRPVSNKVTELFGIEHQSPQALLIKDGKCAYTASHLDIQYKDILKAL